VRGANAAREAGEGTARTRPPGFAVSAKVSPVPGTLYGDPKPSSGLVPPQTVGIGSRKLKMREGEGSPMTLNLTFLVVPVVEKVVLLESYVKSLGLIPLKSIVIL
jgi:hypothetical protein